jgi:hypothetical protein
MMTTGSTLTAAALKPEHTFLLVQEIVDEENYNLLTANLRGVHSICLGGNDKVRLIFSPEEAAELSRKIFLGLAKGSKAMLVPLSDFGISPTSVPAQQAMRA